MPRFNLTPALLQLETLKRHGLTPKRLRQYLRDWGKVKGKPFREKLEEAIAADLTLMDMLKSEGNRKTGGNELEKFFLSSRLRKAVMAQIKLGHAQGKNLAEITCEAIAKVLLNDSEFCRSFRRALVQTEMTSPKRKLVKIKKRPRK